MKNKLQDEEENFPPSVEVPVRKKLFLVHPVGVEDSPTFLEGSDMGRSRDGTWHSLISIYKLNYWQGATP